MKKEVRIIFHIDLNAFFASCAIIKEPYLKDKPFVVGGSSVFKRGVVSTASYAARAYGINSAMNINDALRLYPKLVVVPVDFKLYKKYSDLFFQFLKQFSSVILMGSIDEAYLDVTELSKTKHPLEIAKEIQQGLLKTYQLPCSIGIAPTLFLAKMASDMQKPLGITVIRKKDIVDKLFPLPIQYMYGIGKKTYPRLIESGVLTIGDFTKMENKLKILQIMSSANYASYLDHILGHSSNVIDPQKYAIPKSISNETTLVYALEEPSAILEVIKEQLTESYHRLVKEDMVAKTVGIKLKKTNFESVNRSVTLKDYTDDLVLFNDRIEELLEEHYTGDPLRLVGVFFNQLLLKKDLKIDFNLFTYQELTKREEALYRTIEKINQKYPNKVTTEIKE